MNTPGDLHDLKMSENERKLRDGIFNLNTRRFGKIAEFMISKKYGYSLVKGKTNYDLCQGNRKIEVKFSRVEYKEKDLDLDNCLQICLENANPVSRRIAYTDVIRNDSIIFDRNIQQIKAYEFHELYYGLFFEDQIAIFSIPAKRLKRLMTAQFFLSTKKSPKPNIENIITAIASRRKNDSTIIKSIDKIKRKLKAIENSKNKYAEEAKDFLKKDPLFSNFKKLFSGVSENQDLDETKKASILKWCNDYNAFCEENFFDAQQFSDISPFQHRGNEKAEGQMHINNVNLKYHIKESGCFIEWLSYKDLYSLLEPTK